MPKTEMLSLMTLIGKLGGGDRAVAILGMTYRMVMKWLRPVLNDFSKDIAAFWDSALAGCSAPQGRTCPILLRRGRHDVGQGSPRGFRGR